MDPTATMIVVRKKTKEIIIHVSFESDGVEGDVVVVDVGLSVVVVGDDEDVSMVEVSVVVSMVEASVVVSMVEASVVVSMVVVSVVVSTVVISVVVAASLSHSGSSNAELAIWKY